ncbi:serine hydrolase [Piscinibacter sp. XHJ-5]|uniref:serine hydrolase n=1 Tax=Piscinibacter sp. XHJ-5 TaxID=3037797 RepID=UPI0024533773|nr:serine hydrolase [Piscinibacter sp. XHJ-5]
MLKNVFFSVLLCACFAARADISFESARALVVDEESGQVLFEKNATTAAPIASMTKLMTAMVVLDAGLPADEVVRITREDLDTLKHTTSGVPVGAMIERRDLLQLALMSSDNHAAAALARTYPGGHAGFQAAALRKIEALELENTVIEEPTGLSPNNHATARDMVRILKAASAYPEIEHATSQAQQTILVSGRPRVFRNTNGLVGRPGWDILVSKTGFTQEAGRCLTMRLTAAGRHILIVLMGAMDSWERTLDAHNIQRWLGVPLPDLAAPRARLQPVRKVHKVSVRKRR